MHKGNDNYEKVFDSFDLSDFKKWMKAHRDEANQNQCIGFHVESKISHSKLKSRTHIDEGDKQKIIKDFYENGGSICDSDGKYFIIETTQGKFKIHRMYIKR